MVFVGRNVVDIQLCLSSVKVIGSQRELVKDLELMLGIILNGNLSVW